MIKINTLIATILLLILMEPASAQVDRKYIRSGNEYYKAAFADSTKTDSTLLQNAEVEYRKAIEKKPSSFEGRNNLANSLYKQKKYDEALKEWQSLTGLNIDARKKASLYHNIGNTHLMSNELEKGIEAYKNALRNYPNDTATKYNLAFAQSKLKQQQQQQQNQDQNQDQNQEQDQKNQQQQQNQQQQEQEQQQQQEQQAQQQQGEEKQGEQQQGQESENGEEISKQDAMRILQALEKDEKQLQQELKRNRKKNSKSKKTDKDW